MTSRSFALSSLVAAVPGVAAVVLIVMAILSHSGEIFASIPLAATLVIALICGVVVALAPAVIFFRGDKRAAPAVGRPAAGGSSGEIFAGPDSSDELSVAESSAVLAAAGGTSDEIVAAESGEFGESSEFLAADSAEFEEEDFDADNDSFDDFADESDGDSFFDMPSDKK